MVSSVNMVLAQGDDGSNTAAEITHRIIPSSSPSKERAQPMMMAAAAAMSTKALTENASDPSTAMAMAETSAVPTMPIERRCVKQIADAKKNVAAQILVAEEKLTRGSSGGFVSRKRDEEVNLPPATEFEDFFSSSSPSLANPVPAAAKRGRLGGMEKGVMEGVESGDTFGGGDAAINIDGGDVSSVETTERSCGAVPVIGGSHVSFNRADGGTAATADSVLFVAV